MSRNFFNELIKRKIESIVNIAMPNKNRTYFSINEKITNKNSGDINLIITVIAKYRLQNRTTYFETINYWS